MRIVRETPAQTAARAWKAVEPLGTLAGNYLFKIQLHSEHTVTMYMDNRSRKGFGCTCVHGSMWGVNKPDELCVGVKAVREAIKQRGAFKW